MGDMTMTRLTDRGRIVVAVVVTVPLGVGLWLSPWNVWHDDTPSYRLDNARYDRSIVTNIGLERGSK